MEPSEIRFDSPQHIRAAVGQLYPDETCPTEIMFVLCDAEDRGFVAAPVDDAPKHATLEECRKAAAVFACSLAETCPDGGLFFVIARQAPGYVTDSDRWWYRAIREACNRNQVRALGVWLVTPGLARELAPDDVVV